MGLGQGASEVTLMDHQQQAVDELILHLAGRTIVASALDVEEGGFHLKLDDGNILIVMGNYVVGLYRATEHTLQ